MAGGPRNRVPLRLIGRDEIEFGRARRWLERFCRDRNLTLIREGDFELTVLHMRGESSVGKDGLKFSLRSDGWCVFRYRQGLGWETLSIVPVASSWSELAAALEAAPLHVHWGGCW